MPKYNGKNLTHFWSFPKDIKSVIANVQATLLEKYLLLLNVLKIKTNNLKITTNVNSKCTNLSACTVSFEFTHTYISVAFRSVYVETIDIVQSMFVKQNTFVGS